MNLQKKSVTSHKHDINEKSHISFKNEAYKLHHYTRINYISHNKLMRRETKSFEMKRISWITY